MARINLLLIFLTLGFLSACTPKVPDQTVQNAGEVRITPDYIDVTIPYNIAPLDFRVMEPADRIRAVIRSEQGRQMVLRGRHKNIDIPAKAWRKLLEQNKGKDLYIDIYTHHDGHWTQFRPVCNHIAAEAVDPWLSYRLIEAGYTSYGATGLFQRNLETFDERLVYSNAIASDNGRTQAVGGHAVRQHNGAEWLFQVRDEDAGLMLVNHDDIRKIEVMADSLGGTLMFAAYHPTLPLIAFSVNHNMQVLHSTLHERTDIIDFASDLVLYDMQRQKLSYILRTEDRFETQPVWSPDGAKLFYCSAACPEWNDSVSINAQLNMAYNEIRYDLHAISYDAGQGRFGAVDTVFRFTRGNVSAAFPNLSPDGRYMLVSMARYGSFPGLQHISDIYLLDLETRDIAPLDPVNGNYADGFASWSSDGRWNVVSSCRDDGQYARPYIAYFDTGGKVRKPFLLPQRRQMEHVTRLASYNTPTFMRSPFTISPRQLYRKISGPADVFIAPADQE